MHFGQKLLLCSVFDWVWRFPSSPGCAGGGGEEGSARIGPKLLLYSVFDWLWVLAWGGSARIGIE